VGGGRQMNVSHCGGFGGSSWRSATCCACSPARWRWRSCQVGLDVRRRAASRNHHQREWDELPAGPPKTGAQGRRLGGRPPPPVSCFAAAPGAGQQQPAAVDVVRRRRAARRRPGRRHALECCHRDGCAPADAQIARRARPVVVAFDFSVIYIKHSKRVFVAMAAVRMTSLLGLSDGRRFGGRRGERGHQPRGRREIWKARLAGRPRPAALGSSSSSLRAEKRSARSSPRALIITSAGPFRLPLTLRYVRASNGSAARRA
jgi:hypothetical protein